MKFLFVAALLVGACYANDTDGNGDDSQGGGARPSVPEDMHGVDADPSDNGGGKNLLLEMPAGKIGVSSSDESRIQLTQANNLCGNDNNLAVFATPSGSGGGSGTYGPRNMNDEAACQFYWPTEVASNAATAPSIQYTWTERHLIDRFVLRTDPYCAQDANCGGHSDGRGIASGTVQYWTGSSWRTHGSFANRTTQNIYYYFTDCIRTTAIRIINLVTHPCGAMVNPVVYEWSVCECNLHACGASTNLAPFATPSASAGGAATSDYGVSNLNDLKQCLWFWTRGNDGWIRYYWRYPVYVEKFKIYTDRPCIVNQECADGVANKGRGVMSGTVQWYRPGTGWVTDGTFTSSSEIITYKMSSCKKTQYLRVQHIKAHNCTGGMGTNPVMYEWQVCAC